MAVLTFVKPAYRLGETILGVLDFNGPLGGVRVLKVGCNSAFGRVTTNVL